MSRTVAELIALTCALNSLTGCESPPEVHLGTEDSADTVTYQSGVGGYSNTVDGLITSSGGGNGANDFTSTNTLIMINTPSNYEAEALIRFDGISLPAGSTVTSATVQLTFEDYAGGHSLKGYYVKNTWDTTAKWVPRLVGTNWATPGAKALGTDISSTTAFTDSSWTGAGVQAKTYSLDVATVQGWADTPSTNNGILLMNAATDKQLRVYTAENTTIANRPKLTINYTTGGGGGNCWATSGYQVWSQHAFTTFPKFTAELDATPSEANTDAVFSFTDGATTSFTGMQAIARFYTGGVIEARNGAVYTAANSIPYSAGVTYHFRFVVDTDAELYSVYVTPAGGSEILLGSNYAFRSDAPDPVTLNNIASVVSTTTGSLNLCNLAVTDDGGGDPPPPPGAHPRIWLDGATTTNRTSLEVLLDKARNNDVEWTDLQTKCNSFNGTVLPPAPANGCADNASPPCICAGSGYECGSGQICCGYQGTHYYEAIVPLGLCYQVAKNLGRTTDATNWGGLGVAVLDKMADYTFYGGDKGFGIRFFGTGMALGYDWLNDAMSSGQRTKIVNALNGWMSYYDTSPPTESFRNDPMSNYFTGYYAAKAYASIATRDENSSADSQWAGFMTIHTDHTGITGVDSPSTIHAGVAPFYASFLDGGGWPQGWQYGDFALQNLSGPSLAALTGQSTDLINGSPQFHYPLNSANHMFHFTWPSLKYMDDRDLVHGGGDCPGNARPPLPAITMLGAVLQRWGSSDTDKFQDYTTRVRALASGSAPQWMNFVFWDPGAPHTDFTSGTPRAFLAKNYAAMRSDWSPTAAWGSLRAIPYMDFDQGEQSFDVGGLAITRGDTPFLVNPAFLMRCYPGTSNNKESFLPHNWDTYIYAEDHSGPESGCSGCKRHYNIFYNQSNAGQIGKHADDSPAPTMAISWLEDKPTTGGGYVFTRATGLQDAYNTSAKITNWTRDTVLLPSADSARPGIFVVYDRTTTSDALGDPHLTWMFPPVPTAATPYVATSRRWNVNDSLGGYKGTMTAVLPLNARNDPAINHFGSNKLYRVEIRPPAGGITPTMRWLTVLDTATSATNAANPSLITPSTNNAYGVLLENTGTLNKVVLLGQANAGTAIGSQVVYTQPAANTNVMISDLPAGATWSVTVSSNGTTHTVTIAPGSGGTYVRTTSPRGSLYFNVAAGGAIADGT